MENQNINSTEDKSDLKISWIGIDGLLCICFVVESVVIGYSMINDVDIVLCRLIPYAAMLVNTLIFLKYIVQVISFSIKAGKK